mmetsp:Transcript_20438/g.66676  ORF Transcript_20438/g.66676 Transcript_20438/m.66676 type:complete len:271 (+) Transcript_20438:190-1002(+)
MGDHHVPRHGASTADILPLARQCLRGSPCVAAARFQRDRVLHQRLGAQRDTHLPRPTGGVPVPASLRTLVGRAQTAWLTQQRFAQLGVPRSRVGDRRQPARPHHHADDRLFLVRPRVAAAREARPLRDGGPAGRTAGEPAQRFDVDSDARHRHVARRVRRRGARAAGDGSASAPARPVGDRSRRAAQGGRVWATCGLSCPRPASAEGCAALTRRSSMRSAAASGSRGRRCRAGHTRCSASSRRSGSSLSRSRSRTSTLGSSLCRFAPCSR